MRYCVFAEARSRHGRMQFGNSFVESKPAIRATPHPENLGISCKVIKWCRLRRNILFIGPLRLGFKVAIYSSGQAWWQIRMKLSPESGSDGGAKPGETRVLIG
jgi:hypothetical protein